MTRAASRYLIIESLISLSVCVAVSALITWLVFHNSPRIAIWGLHGLALDTVPQTFIMTFMCVLAPSLLTHSRHAKGRCQGLIILAGRQITAAPTRRAIFLRALGIALVAVAVGAPGTVAIFALAYPTGAPFAILMIYRMAYGAVVGLCVTPIAITCVLHHGQVLAHLKAMARPSHRPPVANGT